MASDKDREEAQSVVEAYLRSPLCKGLPPEWDKMPVFARAIDQAASVIARIRAEAKAEALREAAGLRGNLCPVEPPSWCDLESYKSGWKDAAEVYQSAILADEPKKGE